MKEFIKKVADFNSVASKNLSIQKIDFSTKENIEKSVSLIEMRTRIMTEEVEEMFDAVYCVVHSELEDGVSPSREDIIDAKTQILDSVVDQMYVLLGTIEMMGMSDIFEESFEEVHRSNMTKIVDPEYRSDGKLLKGKHYSPPDLKSIIIRSNVLENNASKGPADRV